MIHQRFDAEQWVYDFPLADMRPGDVPDAPSGPLPFAYVEQMRAEVKHAGGDFGRGTPVDLCVWNLGDSERREVTKVGGVPYWPANTPWPTFEAGTPYTFVAQFRFLDSQDILPRLPGDILSILSRSPEYQWQEMETRWFRLATEELLPAGDVPAAGWSIQPCYADLHRTLEYRHARNELFDSYPSELRYLSTSLVGVSKIGGTWCSRGEYAPWPWYQNWYKQWLYHRRENGYAKNFICELASIQATERQPFLNVSALRDDDELNLLMIADVGGYDFFFDGTDTVRDWWSG